MKIKTLMAAVIAFALITFGAGCVSDSGGEDSPATEEGTGEGIEEAEAGEEVNEEGFSGNESELMTAEFDALMQKANSNYVKALVSTSKKDYNASSEALSGLVEDLTAVSESYAENPPAVYADDEQWPETIDEALAIAVDSREKLLENNIDAAHTALEPMRDLFFELHVRNGIDLVGDRMTEFHTTMEIAIGDANENDTAAVAALIPELEAEWESVSNAEPPASADENYESSLQAVELKITELWSAANLNDTEEAIIVAEELRQAFAQVFAKYGVVIA
ncbi:hypothetical protein MSSAC_0604 [Methanosarcina siciliae C2J]|uniref:Uncharacterized protein n=1 Tax=Methanosarcina siciliae C2J TaxID=1434118 RepID=A0A0E3PKH1_9EURY|nr:hypothetical protein [Methanosarcina siciliae]AKB35194.1 hypothetical protein MSSAC_0604 [Methanosarcina siciliae C2J]